MLSQVILANQSCIKRDYHIVSFRQRNAQAIEQSKTQTNTTTKNQQNFFNLTLLDPGPGSRTKVTSKSNREKTYLCKKTVP